MRCDENYMQVFPIAAPRAVQMGYGSSHAYRALDRIATSVGALESRFRAWPSMAFKHGLAI